MPSPLTHSTGLTTGPGTRLLTMGLPEGGQRLALIVDLTVAAALAVPVFVHSWVTSAR